MIEETTDQADYVKEEKPVGYFKVLDDLKQTKRNFVSYQELSNIANECGVSTPIEVDKMLEYFHTVGVLMWHKDNVLRDVVILDPQTYFVQPITRVVCRHYVTADDATVHNDVILSNCRMKYSKDFKDMMSKGIVSVKLLRALIVDAGSNQGSKTSDEIIDNRIHLMVKYGIIVLLDSDNTTWLASTSSTSADKRYLVPSTLRKSNDILVVTAAAPKLTMSVLSKKISSRFITQSSGGAASIYDVAKAAETLQTNISKLR